MYLRYLAIVPDVCSRHRSTPGFHRANLTAPTFPDLEIWALPTKESTKAWGCRIGASLDRGHHQYSILVLFAQLLSLRALCCVSSPFLEDLRRVTDAGIRIDRIQRMESPVCVYSGGSAAEPRAAELRSTWRSNRGIRGWSGYRCIRQISLWLERILIPCFEQLAYRSFQV